MGTHEVKSSFWPSGAAQPWEVTVIQRAFPLKKGIGVDGVTLGRRENLSMPLKVRTCQLGERPGVQEFSSL